MKKLFRKEMETLESYVPGKPIEDVMREFGLTRVVKLASNENPLGPSPKAVEAIKSEADHINIYPDPGMVELKAALAKKHGVTPEQILCSNGGEAAIQMVSISMLAEGDEIVVGDPSFSLYDIGAQLMGATIRRIALREDDFNYDLEAMLDAVNEKTKIFYLCNPNNPTGTIVTKDDLQMVVDRLPEDVVLFLDEAYFEFARVHQEYPDGLEILKTRPRTIVLRTFAKVSGIAGLRVGYIISDPEIITEVSKASTVFSVNRLAQKAALAALDDEEHIEKSVALARASLSRMMEYFDQRRWRYIKAAGNFIFVDVGTDTRKVFIDLQKEGVIVRPG
ncbi:MAG TPA: histidinol-phosphate transaminase, partial [Tissierellia bacterium]|nr:histidinol-phosphate transaminase [Tissierellia bacterium]